MTIVLATHNVHKLAEIRDLLADLPERLVSLSDLGLPDEQAETGDTFRANALEKARSAHGLTGLLAVADDSGLEVDALGGRPGVHSRRFTAEATAEANNRALLAALDGVDDRRARFRCVVALVYRDHDEVVEGVCHGTITTAPRGTGGFGYDPLFVPDDAPGRTFAELTPAEKNTLGHRGRAFRAIRAALGAFRR